MRVERCQPPARSARRRGVAAPCLGTRRRALTASAHAVPGRAPTANWEYEVPSLANANGEKLREYPNRFGGDGWELVSVPEYAVTRGSGEWLVAVLKRPIDASSLPALDALSTAPPSVRRSLAALEGNMLRVEAPDVFIGRPAEEAFDRYADGRTYPDWFPGVEAVRALTEGPIGRGSKFAGAFPGIGAVEWEVVEYHRPRRQVHLAHAPIGDFTHVLTFEPAPGGTAVRQRGEGKLKGLFAVLSPVLIPFMRGGMARGWVKTATALKHHLETGGAGR